MKFMKNITDLWLQILAAPFPVSLNALHIHLTPLLNIFMMTIVLYHNLDNNYKHISKDLYS